MIQKYTRIQNVDLKKSDLNIIQNIGLHSIEEFDIDKSWEIIHFLITGHKAYFGNQEFSQILSPNNQIIEISDKEDDFYWDEIDNKDPQIVEKWNSINEKIENQISYLKIEEIKNLYSIMKNSNIEMLLDKIDFELLNENDIYPANWANTQETKTYIKEHFTNLTEFFNRALIEQNLIVVH